MIRVILARSVTWNYNSRSDRNFSRNVFDWYIPGILSWIGQPGKLLVTRQKHCGQILNLYSQVIQGSAFISLHWRRLFYSILISIQSFFILQDYKKTKRSWQLLFVSMFMCIHVRLKAWRNPKLKSKVVFIVLIYMTTVYDELID